ncbi:MAG: alpha-L-rhamnosidase N-terminal domain-containing protein, partial [bacterium]
MLKPKKLKTEYIKDPIGIDVKEPRFSWELQNVRKQILMKQTAYQIQVASSKTSLENNTPDMWDSGRVISDETVNIVYQGEELGSKKSYCWRVRVWDEDNNKSEWSDISCWEMGLLDPDDWKAEWITHENEKIDEATPVPYFRKEFVVEKNIKKARLYISGLGNYEAYLNGNKI